MSFRVSSITALVVLLTATLSLAEPHKSADEATQSLTIHNTTFIDANRILMFVTNHGSFGRDFDDVFGYDYGTWYPYTGDTAAISGNVGKAGDFSPQYASGLWMGGMVDGEVRIAVSEYNSEYVPGPMAGGTFMPDEPDFKVYKLYRDSLEGNPNDDYTNWPVDQGAPVDGNGDPLLIGDQTLWSVYNDADPTAHANDAGTTAPLGIEVQQTVYAYDQLGSYGSVAYIEYVIFNRGGNSISDFYISLWSDIEIGTAGDDMVGCDTLNDIFFGYNATNDDGQYGTGPPAAGFKVIAGPLVETINSYAFFDGYWLKGYKNMNMTSFVKYINGTDPDNFNETYDFMHGLTKTGDPYEYDGDELKYMHSGDPVTGAGDVDAVPADRRMMANFGPLEFNPGDSQYVLLVFAVGQGSDNLSSITVMKQLMDLVDLFPVPVYEYGQSQELPEEFTVRQNYPNPFNPSTVIEYSLPRRADVTVDIYNVLGQRVRQLVNKTQPAGVYYIEWDGADQSSKPVSTGLYFYQVKAGDLVSSKKMLLMK